MDANGLRMFGVPVGDQSMSPTSSSALQALDDAGHLAVAGDGVLGNPLRQGSPHGHRPATSDVGRVPPLPFDAALAGGNPWANRACPVIMEADCYLDLNGYHCKCR